MTLQFLKEILNLNSFKTQAELTVIWAKKKTYSPAITDQI